LMQSQEGGAMPGIGIVADTISEDFAHAADRAVAWGITNVELYHLWHQSVIELDDATIERALAIIHTHGLHVTNLATLIMRCPPTDEAEQAQLELFERAVAIGGKFGTNRIRCYAYLKQPDLSSVWDRILRTFERLLALAEAHDVTLLLENSSYANLQMATELRRLLDAVDHPRLQLLWDAGNAFALGDPTPTVEAWHMLKDRIVHLHVKDSVAHGSKEWVPVGDGALDLNGLLKAVKADGYDGIISLEPYFPASDTQEGKVEASAQGLRTAMAAMGLAIR
jgi:sugar phosphate isomerase/epimerase